MIIASRRILLSILIFSGGVGLAAADTGMMPGSLSTPADRDLTLVEVLYPEVMPKSRDPFNDQPISESWLLAHAEGEGEEGG